MIGQTNQSTEWERRREADMFKLFEFLTGGAANEANAYPNELPNDNKLTSIEEYRDDIIRRMVYTYAKKRASTEAKETYLRAIKRGHSEEFAKRLAYEVYAFYLKGAQK